MVDRIGIYNIAIGYTGATRLNRLVEDRADRRELDAVYDRCLALMLEKGVWKFALRTVLIEADPDIDMAFGYSYGFTKPTDFVRLHAIASDEMLTAEIRDYRIENGVIYCNFSEFYMSYVSNDADYGLNLGMYPEHYSEALGALMAKTAGLAINKDRGDRSDMFTIFRGALAEAKTYDAIDDRVKMPPPGRLSRARLGTSGRQRYINETNRG